MSAPKLLGALVGIALIWLLTFTNAEQPAAKVGGNGAR
jgi:hypothetical protein